MKKQERELFKLTDADLSVLRQAVMHECGRRTRMAVEGRDAGAVVYGNELAKRAVLVAAAGGHSLLLLGPSNSGKTMLRAMAFALGLAEVFEARSCPCGNFGAVDQSVCACTAAQITRHRRKIPVAEVNVELCRPRPRDIDSKYRWTSLADLRRQLESALDHERVFTALSDVPLNLLRVSVRELGIDPAAEASIRNVARTICALDRRTEIEPSHICEAINYRTFGAEAAASQPRSARKTASRRAA